MHRGFFGDEIDIAAGSNQVRNFHGTLLAAALERMVGPLKRGMQSKFSAPGSGKLIARELASEAANLRAIHQAWRTKQTDGIAVRAERTPKWATPLRE